MILLTRLFVYFHTSLRLGGNQSRNRTFLWQASDDGDECRHRTKGSCKRHEADIEEISVKYPNLWGFDCGRLLLLVLEGLLPVGCEERAWGNLSQENHHHHHHHLHQYLQNPNHHHRHRHHRHHHHCNHHHHLCRQGAEVCQRPRL